MATVVCTLSGRAAVSSTPMLRDVSAASVVSGSISEMEPTNVVLPTPKPPATTILTGSGEPGAASGGSVSERTDSIEHPLEQCAVGTGTRVAGSVQLQVAGVDHVGDQDAGHAEGHSQMGGHLGDGQGAG